jgi:Protein of unknown function (DUF2530)
MQRRPPRQRHPEVQPVDNDGVATVAVGTALWVVAFFVLLAFREQLAEHDADWWLWVCVAGAGLGVPGMWYCLRRRNRLRRSPRTAR